MTTFLMPAILSVLSVWTPLEPSGVQAPDKWAPLRFLLGTWEGTSTGQPGNGTVRREYRLVLRDQFIEVRNTSTYPPQEKNPKGETHEDVGYISYDRARKAFVFRQFHVEGFVTTYVGHADASGSFVFTSEHIENIPSGWRARETYRRTADDEIVEVFELAQASKEFSVYSETRLRRTPAAQDRADPFVETSPEAQGMSSDDLADALEFARAKGINIHSLAVVRNGALVLDAYFYPFARGMRHDVASVTKSITSLLAGMAIADGRIARVDVPAIDLLPPSSIRGVGGRAARIRLRDLLSMQSGLDCGFSRGEPELREMRESNDWVNHALRLSMTSEPGTRFGYCSPNFHVASAAIARATNASTFEFARARLFDPLGIDDVYWPADSHGVQHGWGDLQLHPRDMAKIGLMLLNGGTWRGRQIVPRAWIDASIAKHATVNQNEDYGLGWWISRSVPTLFEANGRGGQRISVIPAKNVVVVMTGGGFEPGDIGAFLLKAIRSEAPLPEDARAKARLERALRMIAAPPEPRSVKTPEAASRYSGRVYTLADNPMGLRSFTVEFADPTEGVLRLRLASGEELVQTFGLDGVYRVAPDRTGAASAGVGEWRTDGTLRIVYDRLARINRFVFDVRFDGDAVHLTVSEPTEVGTITLRGEVLRR